MACKFSKYSFISTYHFFVIYFSYNKPRTQHPNHLDLNTLAQSVYLPYWQHWSFAGSEHNIAVRVGRLHCSKKICFLRRLLRWSFFTGISNWLKTIIIKLHVETKIFRNRRKVWSLKDMFMKTTRILLSKLRTEFLQTCMLLPGFRSNDFSLLTHKRNSFMGYALHTNGNLSLHCFTEIGSIWTMISWKLNKTIGFIRKTYLTNEQILQMESRQKEPSKKWQNIL